LRIDIQSHRYNKYFSVNYYGFNNLLFLNFYFKGIQEGRIKNHFSYNRIEYNIHKI
jgi:hypothetical protein